MRRIPILLLGLVLSLAAPLAARAHPHEFIDTGISFRFDDQGRLGAVGVVWIWDELTTMLILDEFGADGGDTLAEDTRRTIAARLGQWPEDYDGDLYLLYGDRAVVLGRPFEVVADLRENRLVLGYFRALSERIGPELGPVVLQVYDPGYYVFYDLVGTPEVRGREGCTVEVRKADIAAAQRLYERLLGQLTEEELMEQGKFPEVGGAFADRVVLTCAARP